MIGLVADKLINIYNERLLASSEFNNEKEKRFHSICSFLVGLWQNILMQIDQALTIKAKSPFKFLFGSVPVLSVTAFLGTKIYLTTMLWLFVTYKSIKKIPQVKEQVRFPDGSPYIPAQSSNRNNVLNKVLTKSNKVFQFSILQEKIAARWSQQTAKKTDEEFKKDE